MRQRRFSYGPALLAVILLAIPLSPAQDAATVEVYNLRLFTHPNFTRIVVDVGALREYAPMESRDPGSIYVDIFQARLNPIVREEAIPSKCDYINLIRISQKSAGTVRVTADVQVGGRIMNPTVLWGAGLGDQVPGAETSRYIQRPAGIVVRGSKVQRIVATEFIKQPVCRITGHC